MRAALFVTAALFAMSLPAQVGKLEVSSNHRYFQHSDGAPFFWLGDTAWLLSRI